jgi:integrase
VAAKAIAKPRRHRGDGSLYQRADGIWVGSVDLGTGGDGKRRRKTVSSKDYAAAARKLREVRKLVDEGYTATSAPTVSQWLQRWSTEIAPARLKPRTLVGYLGEVKHLEHHLGTRKLDRLTPAHVRELHRHLVESGRKPSSVLKTHRVLAKALTDAVREGLIVRNVATLVDAPRLPDADTGALTAAQATHLLRCAHDNSDPMTTRWAAALLLGARQGELLGLTWDRVDVDHGTVDLAWQLQALPWTHGCDGTCERVRRCTEPVLTVPTGFEHHPLDGVLALTRPKSRAGRRVIPLPAPLAVMLRHHRDDATRHPGHHDLVWTTPGGGPIAPRTDYTAWTQALAAAGLPGVPLHAARHTTATILMQAGVDAHVVQQILGHSAVLTTRGYQHVSLELARVGMDGLSALLPGQPAVPAVPPPDAAGA